MANVTIYTTDGLLGNTYQEAISEMPFVIANTTYKDRVEGLLDYFLDTNNAVIWDYRNGGFLNFGLLPDGKFKIDLDGYSIWYTGVFSTSGSTVTSVDILDGAGFYIGYSGNIRYEGLPLFSPQSGNASLTTLSSALPDSTSGTVLVGNVLATPMGVIQGQIESWLWMGIDGNGKALREVIGGGNLVFNNNLGYLNIVSGEFTTISVDLRDYPLVVPDTLLDYIIIEGASIPLAATPATINVLSGNDTITLTGTRGSEAYGSTGNDSIYGSPYADTIFGEAGNDYIVGNGGDDLIYGGSGLDTAGYIGRLDQYLITAQSSRSGAFSTVRDLVVGRDGTDSLQHVERLQFSDTNLALDTTGVSGEAYRIYKAAFNRTPDLQGLGYWIAKMDEGVTVVQVAGGFIGSAEFQGLYGVNPSNEQFVDLLYKNVLDRNPDASGYAYWNSVLFNGLTRADVLAYFSESPENVTNVAPLISGGIEYTPFVG